jgi:hypothetical protein
MFILKKLNEVQGKEQYRVEFSNSFAALEDLEAEVDIKSAQETFTVNINFQPKSLGYYELRKHMSWFDEGYSELLDQWKQAKLQWLQDNLNNVRLEVSRHSGKKEGIAYT